MKPSNEGITDIAACTGLVEVRVDELVLFFRVEQNAETKEVENPQ
jgi:hypothetical protein